MTSRTIRRGGLGLLVFFIIGFATFGIIGTGRYIWTFYLYRGFPAPVAPKTIDFRNSVIPVQQGTVLSVEIVSTAIARLETVIVFLPPGYERSKRRYPVLYLLHGVPGLPANFVNAGNIAVDEEVLIAQHRMKPIILVMPTGAPGSFTDEEWANGVRPHNDWETYVTRDVVNAIDSRYRTIPDQASRGIGGYSEGGYGAFNMAVQHPREFGFVESWSGYTHAAKIPAIFGRSPHLLIENSPAYQINVTAPILRSSHVDFWFYCGQHDDTKGQNKAFALELTRLDISHQFTIWPGRKGQTSSHNWRLWRDAMPQALIAASKHLVSEA